MSKALDHRALRAFVATAREGSVSRAAAKLHLSQPAVSLQLKQLAEIVGLELFLRSGQGLLLSRDGAALLPLAERALQAQAEFLQAAQRLQGSVRGVLRVGTILDPEFTRLGAFLRELGRLAPELQPELHQGMSGQVLEALQRGRLDVGYAVQPAGAPPPEGLSWQRLSGYRYRVVAPAGWGPQLQGRGWAELARLPWISTPTLSSHRRLLDAVLGPLGVQLNAVALVDQESSMLALVRSGVGLSLVREALALQLAQAEGLAVAPEGALEAELGFACTAGARKQPLLACAFEALAKAWR